MNDSGDQSATKCETLSLLIGTKCLMLSSQTMNNLNITDYFLLSDSEVALGGVTSLTANQKLYYAQRNFEARGYIEALNINLFKVGTRENDCDCFTKKPKGNFNAAKEKSYWRSNFLH